MARENLHGLPPELIGAIFKQLPDLQSVGSMALTCSKFHQVYRDSRRGILSQIALNQYGDLIPEAIAAVRSEGLSFEDHEEEATALLDRRRRHKEIMKPSIPRTIQPNTFANAEEIIKMLRLNETIQSFMKVFSKPYKVADKPKDLVDPIPPLSDLESRRFARALLRIQTYCNIFGKRETDIDVQNSQALDLLTSSGLQDYFVPPSMEIINRAKEHDQAILFGPLPPWEVEEFACVWTQLQELSSSVVEGVLDALYYNTIGQLAPEDAEKKMEYRRHFDDMVSRIDPAMPLLIGPKFMHRFFRAGSLDRSKMLMANAHEYANKLDFDMFTAWPYLRPGMKHLLDPVELEHYNAETVEKMMSKFTGLERPNRGWIEKVKRVQRAPLTQHTDYPIWNFDQGGVSYQDVDWRWGYAIWDDESLPWAQLFDRPPGAAED